MHRHHIVFRSQGGLDFDLNFKFLTLEEHEGKNGPHQNRETDLRYKRQLQSELDRLFPDNGYTKKEIAEKLGKSEKYFDRHLKLDPPGGPYRGETIVRALMGGRRY